MGWEGVYRCRLFHRQNPFPARASAEQLSQPAIDAQLDLKRVGCRRDANALNVKASFLEIFDKGARFFTRINFEIELPEMSLRREARLEVVDDRQSEERQHGCGGGNDKKRAARADGEANGG